MQACEPGQRHLCWRRIPSELSTDGDALKKRIERTSEFLLPSTHIRDEGSPARHFLARLGFFVFRFGEMRHGGELRLPHPPVRAQKLAPYLAIDF